MRVGLVGAGPWAQFVHASMLSAEPGMDFVGIWARRPEAASELAAAHDVDSYESIDELFDSCDAVSFAVPPNVQADLAAAAARRGCHVLLEKPIGSSVAEAEALTAAIDEAGVGSMVLFTWRYAEAVREFLAAAASFDASGGAGRFVAGGLLDGPFMTPWRLERGALLDLGPHVIDLLDAALGPVVGVRAAGDLATWTTLHLEHESGVVSEATMSATIGGGVMRSGAELYGPDGVVEIDCAANGFPPFGNVTTAFLAAASGDGGFPDAARGLHIQRIIADAEAQLR